MNNIFQVKMRIKSSFLKNVRFIGVFIVITWCFVSSILFNGQKKDYELIILNGKKRYDEVIIENALLKNNYLLMLTSRNIQLSDTITLQSIHNNIIYLKDIAENGLLFFRLNKNECYKCNQYFLTVLNNTFSNEQKEKIIILTNYQNNKTFKLNYPQVSFPVYFISQIPLPHEEINRSYFFSLDKHLNCSEAFFFEKDMKNIFSAFLNSFNNK